MAGLYIHIPFCKVKCHYCDFHFSVQHQSLEKVIEAMCQDINIQKNYLEGEVLDTIYFGGGTPSLLDEIHFNKLFNAIYSNLSVSKTLEITAECNPDDLSQTKLEVLKKVGINRLSIGIQSFDEGQLQFLNRAHSSAEAEQSVILAQKSGFENITIDLIYGLPNTDQN